MIRNPSKASGNDVKERLILQVLKMKRPRVNPYKTIKKMNADINNAPSEMKLNMLSLNP
jgi:hypothetical protein